MGLDVLDHPPVYERDCIPCDPGLIITGDENQNCVNDDLFYSRADSFSNGLGPVVFYHRFGFLSPVIKNHSASGPDYLFIFQLSHLGAGPRMQLSGPPHKERRPLTASGNYEGGGVIVWAAGENTTPPAAMKPGNYESHFLSFRHQKNTPPPATMKARIAFLADTQVGSRSFPLRFGQL